MEAIVRMGSEEEDDATKEEFHICEDEYHVAKTESNPTGFEEWMPPY